MNVTDCYIELCNVKKKLEHENLNAEEKKALEIKRDSLSKSIKKHTSGYWARNSGRVFGGSFR